MSAQRPADSAPDTAASKRAAGAGDGPQELWGHQVDRQALGGADVLRIYQVYAGQEGRPGEWLPLLVLQRQVAQQQVNLVYVPAISLLKLTALDELGSLLPRYMSHYTPDCSSIGCSRSRKAMCSMHRPRPCWSAS